VSGRAALAMSVYRRRDRLPNPTQLRITEAPGHRRLSVRDHPALDVQSAELLELPHLNRLGITPMASCQCMVNHLTFGDAVTERSGDERIYTSALREPRTIAFGTCGTCVPGAWRTSCALD